MCAVVLEKIKHAIALKHLVGRPFREREHVFRCIMFLLVDPTAFDPNRIYQHRDKGHRHSDLHFVAIGSRIRGRMPPEDISRPRGTLRGFRNGVSPEWTLLRL